MWVPQYDYLEHHGVPGQKWGVRRYQNYDGSFTAQGKARRKLNEGMDGQTTVKRTNAPKYHAWRPQKNNIPKHGFFENLGASLGLDKRDEYLDAKKEEHIYNNPYMSDYGDMAQEHIDEISEKYIEIGWDKLTDEDAADLEYFTYFRDRKAERDKEFAARTRALFREYKATPIGSLETTFNKVVDSGKDFVSNAISDIGDFFGNLFK